MNCLLKWNNQARRAFWLVIHLVGNTDNGNDKIGAATETELVTGLPGRTHWVYGCTTVFEWYTGQDYLQKQKQKQKPGGLSIK